MHCVKRDVIIAELSYHVGVTNIAEKNIDLVVPGFEPRTSRKPGEFSTIELHMIAVFLLCKISMSERACSLHILCVSDSRYIIYFF